MNGGVTAPLLMCSPSEPDTQEPGLAPPPARPHGLAMGEYPGARQGLRFVQSPPVSVSLYVRRFMSMMVGSMVPPGSLQVSGDISAIAGRGITLSVQLLHPGWHPWLNQRHPK